MITRARETAHLVAARRIVMGGRRRRIPRQVPPTAVERAYRAALLGLVARIREALAPVLAELPSVLAEARLERADAWTSGLLVRRNDAAGRRGKEIVERAKARVRQTTNMADIEALARTFAERTATHQRIQLEKQTRAALGADAILSDTALPGLINGFVVENAQLIESIPEKLMVDVALAVSRAVAQATPWPKLAVELEEKLGFAEDRARLIARDQVGKLYGQVAIARQKSLGSTKYIWRTARDARVRGNPDGLYPKAEPSHFDREGKVYNIDDPPEGGHPGEEINCRCYPEPVFEEILGELDAFIAAAEEAGVRRSAPRRRR